MRLRLFSEDNASVAYSLSNIASLYKDMGNFEKSKKFYLESISTKAKVLGESHPSYANSLLGLGELYFLNNILNRSDSCYAIALPIYAKYNPRTRKYGNALRNYADLLETMGKTNEAQAMRDSSDRVIYLSTHLDE